ncbi:MAG: hypothetical protein A2992_01550 [Elusimicrobia bacterium RIFCSPLOWO2_01_FULL_59_12]|nr:MAG: hypothetical protein A2992_01550 [Elusimicrobia bacterium RIFCSPLOWO2_01_FULL_59_12]
MKKIKSLEVKSVFRVSLILGAVAGALVGVIIMIADFVDRRFLEGIVTLFLAPILYGVVGALVNAFMAKIYNLVAGRVGGIEIELD